MSDKVEAVIVLAFAAYGGVSLSWWFGGVIARLQDRLTHRYVCKHGMRTTRIHCLNCADDAQKLKG